MKDIEGGFISIFFGRVDLPISGISVQGRKYSCIAKRVDKLIHEQYRVQIQDRQWVHFSIVTVHAKSSIFPLQRKNQWGSFHMGGFHKSYGEHSIYLRVLKFSWHTRCVAWGWVYRSAIHLLQFDSVHHLNRTYGSVAHTLDLCEHINNFGMIRQYSLGSISSSGLKVFESSPEISSTLCTSFCSSWRLAGL